ncbi:olfactory receptor 11A1-like [Xenopus tropicalis]|uniref:Olfactory receptor 11A1-like n=1 Tax=Xenopus tropicalis TaxID=8364 RepID=A0A8J0QVM6_XENTR|nr:olfactory receptor 11A1-like [Xenopus tropicalis]
MLRENQTLITELYLVGFGDLHNFNIILFAVVLIIFITALMSNGLVIILVATCKSLHSPMYFFLTQLSLSEVLFTSNIVPNMLRLILAGGGTMSVNGCITQFYFLGAPTIAQCLLLAAMSFDRYVAICKPLHYTSVLTFRLQLHIVMFCWTSGFTLALPIDIFLHKLQFCHSNVINHFYCDIAPVIELSCSDTSSVKLLTSLVSMPVVLLPFTFIIATYISIICTILRIPSNRGRQKAFSTCSSHLIVVSMYYGTLTTIYIVPTGEHSVNANKVLSLLYSLVTPLFNPIIYSLRNQDIRRAISKSVSDCSSRVAII